MALVAPAGPVTAERVEISVQRCRALGLEPIVYPAALERRAYLAGTDAQRLADLQSAFDDPAIDAIWALRGGYGTTRILSQIDTVGISTAPKAYIGFSDNTAVHALLYANSLVSFHGPHPGAEFPPESFAVFQRVLFSAEPAGILEIRAQDPPPVTLRGGCVEAPLIGGNLALLGALCGTAQSVSADGAILFIEDVGEPAYRVDRLLVQLRESRVLDGVAGLALGRFSEVDREENELVMQLFTELAQQLEIPAVFDFPIGHVEHNWTLPIGVRARLNADACTLEITEAAVSEA